MGVSNDPLAGEGGPANAATLNLADAVAAAPTGEIYIADRNSGRLLQVKDGILNVLYRANFNAGENDVAGVAVAPDGTVAFTTGQTIRTIPPGGGGPNVLSSDKAAMGTSGGKLAYAPDGTLYFGTGRLNPRVYRVETDGKLTPVAGTGGSTGASAAVTGPANNTAIGRVGEIAADSQGRLYVADESIGAVRRVDTDGTMSTVAGGGDLDPRTGQGAQAPDAQAGSERDGRGSRRSGSPVCQRRGERPDLPRRERRFCQLHRVGRTIHGAWQTGHRDGVPLPAPVGHDESR